MTLRRINVCELLTLSQLRVQQALYSQSYSPVECLALVYEKIVMNFIILSIATFIFYYPPIKLYLHLNIKRKGV